MRSPADGDRPRVGVSSPPMQVQQRRLAGPRRPHQREELAWRNIEVDALQDVDALAAAVIDLVEVRMRHERVWASLHLDLVAVLQRLRAVDDHPFAGESPDIDLHLVRRFEPDADRPAFDASSLTTNTTDRAVDASGSPPSGTIIVPRRAAACAGGAPSRRNETLTPMSGRIRGSSLSNPMRTLTVAFCRFRAHVIIMITCDAGSAEGDRQGSDRVRASSIRGSCRTWA